MTPMESPKEDPQCSITIVRGNSQHVIQIPRSQLKDAENKMMQTDPRGEYFDDTDLDQLRVAIRLLGKGTKRNVMLIVKGSLSIPIEYSDEEDFGKELSDGPLSHLLTEQQRTLAPLYAMVATSTLDWDPSPTEMTNTPTNRYLK